ncbi:hypothetical protein MMC29_001596 [Sticta canariensis]|nr:hypothetical protein [Sticta canariensis]
MKTTAQKLGLAAILTLLANTAVNAACSTRSGVTITFYGYPDNDPPGPATAYNCGGRNYQAGGVGTYSNPLTFASASGEFSSCEIIYLPYLKKYVRYEDYCAQCTTDWGSGKYHIDIWTGSSTVNGGNNQIQCENQLTPNPQSIVRQPPNNLPVDCKISPASAFTHPLQFNLLFKKSGSISIFAMFRTQFLTTGLSSHGPLCQRPMPD